MIKYFIIFLLGVSLWFNWVLIHEVDKWQDVINTQSLELLKCIMGENKYEIHQKIRPIHTR